MAEPRLLKDTTVRVDEVDASNRLRPVSEKAVASLIASIEELGFMQDAIHVRKKKGGKLVLIKGAHRLEAAKRLGWDEIEAKVWTDVTDDWAEMAEIDDNVAGGALTILDLAVFLSRRKQTYERRHPEARRGHVGGLARHDQLTDNLSVSSFASTAAEFLGVSERKVFRLVAAGNALDPDEVSRLRQAPQAMKLTDLQQIAKIGQPSERYHVVDALAGGTAKSAAEARKQWAVKEHGEPAPKDHVETSFNALRDAWRRAPKAARRRFLEVHGEEVAEVLADLDEEEAS